MTEKIAFVFPGQGSQTVGMLHEFTAEYSTIIQKTFDEASQILGYDLWQMCEHGAEDQLNQTEKAQPVLLTAGVALWKIWHAAGGRTPILLAGHSLGEYTALTCAGVIDFTDAVKLVADRGRIMQEAVHLGKGAMAAIVGLTTEQVEAICEEAKEDALLQPANYNSPGQIVIAGEATAVQRAVAKALEHKAKIAKVLAVSIPSHCSLMHDASMLLQERLKAVKFVAPHIPVVNNVDAKIYDDIERIKDALVRQLYSPVRWIEVMQFIQQYKLQTDDSSICAVFECGPGKVLSGLNKRIVNNIKVETLGLLSGFHQALSSL